MQTLDANICEILSQIIGLHISTFHDLFSPIKILLGVSKLENISLMNPLFSSWMSQLRDTENNLDKTNQSLWEDLFKLLNVSSMSDIKVNKVFFKFSSKSTEDLMANDCSELRSFLLILIADLIIKHWRRFSPFFVRLKELIEDDQYDLIDPMVAVFIMSILREKQIEADQKSQSNLNNRSGKQDKNSSQITAEFKSPARLRLEDSERMQDHFTLHHHQRRLQKKFLTEIKRESKDNMIPYHGARALFSRESTSQELHQETPGESSSKSVALEEVQEFTFQLEPDTENHPKLSYYWDLESWCTSLKPNSDFKSGISIEDFLIH